MSPLPERREMCLDCGHLQAETVKRPCEACGSHVVAPFDFVVIPAVRGGRA